MKIGYNQIAGGSLERIAALSDGVFAIAMTILVLDLHVPAAEAIHGDAELARALAALAPRLIMYVMSFMTLGIFWVGQQTQLSHLAHSDRNLAWLHIAYLMVVSLMPFSTALLASFLTYRLALVVYWLNMLLLGVALWASWRYARRAGLLKPEMTLERACAVERRIVVYQLLYALCVLLCPLGTVWSIVLIVLLQLNSAVAPNLGRLSRI